MSNKQKFTGEEKVGMAKVSFGIYTIHIQGNGMFSCDDFYSMSVLKEVIERT